MYIGMDANTTTISSSSLSQAYLSQRWYDPGLLFHNLKTNPYSPHVLLKELPLDDALTLCLLIHLQFCLLKTFLLIIEPLFPLIAPLFFYISVDLFSEQVKRLALPPTNYHLPKPSVQFLDAFQSLFQWDIDSLSSDVDSAYICWNQWAQQYLTLLSDHDFHSHGAAPCVRTGRPATPISRELPASHRPYATLFNQVVSAIAQLQQSPTVLSDSRFKSHITSIHSSAHTLFPAFRFAGSPLIWLPQLRDTLTEYRLHEQQQMQHERREVWQFWVRDTWALNSKKIYPFYPLVKGKSVEPFTCLQHEGDITLSLQSHCFMVARNLIRIIINNEISLIIIFRYCCNNIDIFDVSQKYQYFFQKNNNIFDKNNNIFNNIF